MNFKKFFSKIIVVSLILMIFPFFYSFAQEGNLKQDTVKRQTILDFKDELNLSEKQIKEIEKLLAEFKSKESETVKRIQQHDKSLKQLLQSEGDIKEIKREVREIYRLRGELVAEELETARKIEGHLTEEQKKKWREIRIKGVRK